LYSFPKRTYVELQVVVNLQVAVLEQGARTRKIEK
jgi:hypothetical protein